MYQDPQYLNLSNLLEQDLSSYEFFQSLPPSVQRELEQKDVQSFEELQQCAAQLRSR